MNYTNPNPVEYYIQYVAADGNCRMTSTQLMLMKDSSLEELQERIINLMTDFVKSRWYRIEVTTPLVNNYGNLEGGYKVLLVTRNLVV